VDASLLGEAPGTLRAAPLIASQVDMDGTVAYFCMEFGLHEEFPIYAGGLGILAGDFIKSAHDLGLPVIGIGLRWERGYSRQRIGDDGLPVSEFPTYPASFLEDTGIRVRVRIGPREVEARVWRTERWQNAPLLLLEPVAPRDAWITRRLYDTTLDCRVAQEILLGVGGVRALRKLGLAVDTYHFNEGHAVFAGVELIAERMSMGEPFARAWEAVRDHIVFTTHTPVAAGNEQHAVDDLRRLGACCELVDHEIRAIGGDPFNMTVAGLRLARRANAVSQLHGHVSREMWRDVTGAATIDAITNGVHAPTWQDGRMRDGLGSGDTLWTAHQVLKRELLDEVALRTGVRLQTDVLTIGFARRAAAYKRSDLIFRDPARIAPLLESGRLQILFAGKAHPDDADGRRIVGRLVEMSRSHQGTVVFVPDYDMKLGRLLTRGADVWLNNPIRPLEACGTSGMKAGMNGVLNLSVLDGWWPEACEHGVNGWAIGPNETIEGEHDDADAASLYATLEQEVVPAYADRARWVGMMQASIAICQTRFSSNRMVQEYFDRLYART
jgi:starch phosphorylase